jgi:hypothetical protein
MRTATKAAQEVINGWSHEDDFLRAWKRVGGIRLNKNGEWFLSLCREEFPAKGGHTSEREALWHDLLALGILACRTANDSGPKLSEEEHKQWESAARLTRPGNLWPLEGPVEKSFEYRAWWNSVRGIRQRICTGVQDLLEGRTVRLCLASMIYEVPPQGGHRLFFPFDRLTVGKGLNDVVAGLEGAVLLRFQQFLEKHAPLIRSCEGCNTTFIAHRRDQKFCRGACRAKLAMRRMRSDERHTLATKRGGTARDKK